MKRNVIKLFAFFATARLPNICDTINPDITDKEAHYFLNRATYDLEQLDESQNYSGKIAMRNRLTITFLVLCISAFVSGCTFLESIKPPPSPTYWVYRSPSFHMRLETTNWTNAGDEISNSITDWNNNFSNSVKKISAWAPNPDLLLGPSFKDACLEFGQTDTNYLNYVTNALMSFFFDGANGYFKSALSSNGHLDICAEFRSNVVTMLRLADFENTKAFATNISQLKAEKYDKDNLPDLMSQITPVGVSIYSSWPENSSTVASDLNESNSAAQNAAASNNIIITVETGANPAKTKTASASQVGSANLGFDPDQPITLSLSSMLNSASVWDRIDYVNTYAYVYPYQYTIDGDVVLEREFWKRFFSINITRDPTIRTNDVLLTEDFRRAIEDVRVHIHDISTKVDLAQVELGTQQQTYGNSGNEGLGVSAQVPNVPAGVSAQTSYSASRSVVENQSAKLQFDQRSTYTSGDFFRISQRGMQSADIAGRLDEGVKLHIPISIDTIPVLVPADDTNHICSVSALSEPIYSRIDAITFSVVIARRPTSMVPLDEESYGIEDPKSAVLIVSVSNPKNITIWQYERQVDQITTWDVLGKTGTAAKLLYFTDFDGDAPSPLVLANFDYPHYSHMLEAIRRNSKTNGVVTFSSDQVAGLGSDSLRIGLRSNDGSRLEPIR